MDIRRFPWIRRLAVDYAFEYERLASYYADNPANAGAWSAAIARAQRHPRNRAAVADLIVQQQRTRGGPPEALAAARQLHDAETVAVVTGQQAGLFGGPLFTLLKALTALQLAERLRTVHHVPAVALFWIDAEDHDWQEVKHCGLLDAELEPRSVSLGDPSGANTAPVARVRLDDTATAAIDALGDILPATEFTPGLIEGLRRAYAPGTGMAEAFGRWLEGLLGPRGLVVFDSSDPAAKPLASGVFAHEIAHAGETARLASEAGASLDAAGYHAQVTVAAGSVALFHLDGGREPIRLQDDGAFRIGARTASADGLLEQVSRAPADFSPSVLLRPLVQDALFPTVCYVSGPSELAYLGQLKAVYAAFGIPMPLVHPRTSVTLVDSNTMRFLTRHDFPVERLRARDEAALNELLGAHLPARVDASLEEAARAVDTRLQALVSGVGVIDPTLEGAARSTQSRMQDELKKLHGKIIQATKRKDDTLRRQVRHAQAQAFPDGEPQERQLGFVYFLNRYGPALLDRLSETVPGQPGTHYVLTV